MKLLWFLFVITILIITISCESKFPDYTETSSGIYYKIHELGEVERKPKNGEYITVDLIYKTMTDSVFFCRRRKFPIENPEFKGDIDECFTLLSVGDSASFIINANLFFKKTLKTDIPKFLLSSGLMKIDARLIDVQSEKEFINDKKEFLSWIEDFAKYEKTILKHFLEEKELGVDPTKSGLYYLTTQKGHGPKVKLGDSLSVHYEGRFLDGKIFDSTKRRNQSFQFVYGQEWQVIKGLEESIGMMCEGEHALVIVPSTIAFGTDGSSTGIIPPYTTVVFEVELIKVN